LNNIRDVETDAAAGKRTLAVRAGRSAARSVLFAAFVVAYAMPAVAVLTGRAAPLLLLPLATAPLPAVALRNSAKRTRPPLLRALVLTARTVALYAIAWALALVFS